MKMKPSTYLFAIAGVIAVGLIGYAVSQANFGPSPYDDFAQCLTENEVTMYGAWWCPNCKNQIKEFEGAFDHVDYVECSPGQSRTMTQECQDEGIQGYPTWRFADGSELSGHVPLSRLSEKSGCALPDNQ